ncbi:hypothetical protein GH714_026902 [Hevea brasiliensis]|uniref:NB-ARC domain-containing protein n=1 Tax=Hevea brasiliensis TaxID=3981 RepID=A0A6A6N7X3_HEVBR|nr:hypothetical protein GH714_026902 [Hevea brasiliensis]
MAQGYVKSSDPSQCLIDVGLEYFGDLLWRSFFQEVEKDDLGNYTTCKMHDLMHDLAMSVVGEECTSSNFEANKVRTFLLLWSMSCGNEEETPQIKELCNAMSALSCLRVLDLHGLGIMSVPRSVEKLKHLRIEQLERELEIVNLGYVKNGKSEFKAANLKEKQHLQSLALEWNKDGDDSEGANDVENDEMEVVKHTAPTKI